VPSARRSGLSRRCLGGLPRPDIVLLNTTIFLYDLQLVVGSCAARRCGGGTLGRSGGGGAADAVAAASARAREARCAVRASSSRDE
jgi:hypothetical protein